MRTRTIISDSVLKYKLENPPGRWEQIAGGANIWEAALCGTIGAGGQISRIGNIPLCQDEIIQLLQSYAGRGGVEPGVIKL